MTGPGGGWGGSRRCDDETGAVGFVTGNVCTVQYSVLD